MDAVQSKKDTSNKNTSAVTQQCVRAECYSLAEKRPADEDQCAAVKFFSKLNYLIFGYFNPVNIYFDNKNT